jgi:hypothetical protein
MAGRRADGRRGVVFVEGLGSQDRCAARGCVRPDSDHGDERRAENSNCDELEVGLPVSGVE